MYLTDFNIIRPPFECSQEEALSWIVDIHTVAEKALCNTLNEEAFHKQMKLKLIKVSGKRGKMGKRAAVLSDMVHRDWQSMRLYNAKEKIKGFGERARLYAQFVDGIFSKFYADEMMSIPEDLIHVTCTGYNAPSGAQKLVSKKGWEKKTTVTHAYHMGCYGAMPAIRIASGFGALGKKRIDIVHTELCSLHLNPYFHEEEQLVAQTLFADGLIKYSLITEKPNNPSLKVLTIHEELLPGTEKEMGWECEDWGLKMTLSRDIPQYIEREIRSFMERLEKKAGRDLKKAHYALHPGGPKIISLIQNALHLSSSQIEITEKILFNCGNMSSATLPHIWEALLHDPSCPKEGLIVGLAFGPGLCICGIVLEKNYD